MTKIYHRCEQCQGTGIFMKFECHVCEGKKRVDPEAV